MKEYIPYEHDEQVMLFEWVEMTAAKYPHLAFCYSNTNGGKRHPSTARKLKESGAKAGIPDIFFPYPVDNYHGLWIELKRKKGGRVSPEQRFWINYLKEQNYSVHVCKGHEQAIDTICDYLGIDG